MVEKDKISLQISDNISPLGGSVCEVQAYHCKACVLFPDVLCYLTNTKPLQAEYLECKHAFGYWTANNTKLPYDDFFHVNRCLCYYCKCGTFVNCNLLCVTELDEATTESSDHNATSFTEVDKRVKRRLLMGNIQTPRIILSTGRT